MDDVEGVQIVCNFFFQAEDGIRDLVRSRGLGDVYKRQHVVNAVGFIFWICSSTNKKVCLGYTL